MASDGTITFSTELDNSSLEEGLKKAEKDVEELQRKLEEKTSERNAIAEKLLEVGEEVKATEERIAELKQRVQELTEMGETGQMPMEQVEGRVKAVNEELQRQMGIYDQQLDKGVQIAKQYNDADAEVQKISTDLDKAKQKQQTLGDEYAKSYGKATQAFNAGMNTMNARFDAFMGKITKRVKKLFVFSFIFGALSAMKKYVVSAIKENERFQASVDNMHAVLAGLATPILNVLIPALTTVVNIIAAMLTTLAGLVDSIFNTNFAQSIRDSQAAMMAQKAANDAVEDNTAATKQNAKAKKEAARWLAAFDELNLAQKNDDDSDDGGFDSPSIGGGGGATPNWDLFDVGKIDEKLAEIMLIVGAALLAVGAILCFSGINIPLGITLMAIGALMIYTAAQEQWDKLPEEVRNAISAALVITGMVLIVLGAVLAFSAINIPLGIGMIAAGALLIWTAVALNWALMPEEMQTVVSILMGILGAAILAIGAILALSGGGTPLGIALMAIGAASIVAAVALNWEKMAMEVKQAITVITMIVSVALLAIGAILTFTAANIPVGIALLVAGAIGIIGAAVLSWDTMPREIRKEISTILAIIGGALIVLGVILCVTGVALPLGVACIVAGVGSLVAAVAINWDAMLEKIKGVWRNIVSWFNSNVSRIFTIQFWANKFKAIVNGLISMANRGLSAFGWFVNNIADAICGILDFFGVGGYSFSIGMPQIPYLAQGAVIPPNREFMAVLGDQRNGRNLEAPEGLLRQIVREESGDSQLLSVVMQILQAVQNGQVIECDGYTLAKVVNDRNVINGRIMGY